MIYYTQLLSDRDRVIAALEREWSETVQLKRSFTGGTEKPGGEPEEDREMESRRSLTGFVSAIKPGEGIVLGRGYQKSINIKHVCTQSPKISS